MPETAFVNYPDKIVVGDSHSKKIKIFEDRAQTEKPDISGWTVWFTVKEDINDPDEEAVIQKEITTHTNAQEGVTLLSLSNEDTDIEPDEYHYDIQFTKDDGDRQTVMLGMIEFREGVTQS